MFGEWIWTGSESKRAEELGSGGTDEQTGRIVMSVLHGQTASCHGTAFIGVVVRVHV